MKPLHLCLILSLALTLVTGAVAGADGTPNPGVLPPSSRVQGLTYGEWSAVYMGAFLAIPIPLHPAAGAPFTDCYFARVGSVGLAQTLFVGPDQVVSCELPTGMMLFLPIAAAECSTLEVGTPWYGESEEELTACAIAWATTTDLQAAIDGVPVPHVSDYVFTSPLYELTVPDDNLLGVPAGSGQFVAHGAWLMVAPLSPGEHTLELHGYHPPADLWFGLRYEITVVN